MRPEPEPRIRSIVLVQSIRRQSDDCRVGRPQLHQRAWRMCGQVTLHPTTTYLLRAGQRGSRMRKAYVKSKEQIGNQIIPQLRLSHIAHGHMREYPSMH